MSLNLNKRKLIILTVLTIMYTMGTVGIYIQAPFYPRIAQEKGVSSIHCSGVFASFNLACFFVSPFCGLLVTLIDPYIIVKTSIFIIGITNILFGLLDKIFKESIFLSLSYMIRIIEGFGVASFDVAAFSIAAEEFPDDIGVILGVFETGMGIGLIIGPLVGGVLYMYGEFILPFIASGLFTICIFFIFLFMKSSDIDIIVNLNYKDVFSFFKRTECFLSLLTVFIVSLSLGVVETNLEPHVRILNLSIGVNSLFFALIGFSYSIFSIGWGKLCDKGKPPQLLWCVGTFLICISLIFLGPAPYLNISLNIPLCCISVFIFGIGIGGLIIPPFFYLHRVALEMGFPDDVRTHGLVSSTFNASFYSGQVVGSIIGGLFRDKIGIPWGLQVLSIFCLLLIGVTLINEFKFKDTDFPKPKHLNKEEDTKITLTRFN